MHAYGPVTLGRWTCFHMRSPLVSHRSTTYLAFGCLWMVVQIQAGRCPAFRWGEDRYVLVGAHLVLVGAVKSKKDTTYGSKWIDYCRAQWHYYVCIHFSHALWTVLWKYLIIICSRPGLNYKQQNLYSTLEYSWHLQFWNSEDLKRWLSIFSVRCRLHWGAMEWWSRLYDHQAPGWHDWPHNHLAKNSFGRESEKLVIPMSGK